VRTLNNPELKKPILSRRQKQLLEQDMGLFLFYLSELLDFVFLT
jgi:hypothetical protein